MPRSPKFPPTIHTHKKGYAFVRVAGVERRLGPPGSDQARAAYAQVCAELQAHGGRLTPPDVQGDHVTVLDVCVRWFSEHAAHHYSERSREVEQYRHALRPLRRLFGHLPATAFGVDQLEALQRALASGSWMTEEEKAARQKTTRRLGWSRGVVNRQIVRVRTVWRWAERRRLVPEGRWAALCAVPGLSKAAKGVRHSPRPTPTSREDLDAVLPDCPPAVGAALELQWLAGMRSCEVRGMRTQDVDRSGDVWFYKVRPDYDKNSWREDHAPRVVPLGPECQRVLAPWLRDGDAEGYVFRPQKQRRRRPGDHVAYRNTCYSRTGYAQAVRRACELASVRLGRTVKIIPYGGRHAAKDRITRAAGADAARAQLGQRSIEMTSHYGSLDLEHASEVMKKIG